MEQKKRIYELSFEELKEKLQENFIKVGKQLPKDDFALSIIVKEVIRFNPQMWVESLDDAFSYFAAKRLPGLEKLKPEVSSYFITQIRDGFFQMFKQMKQEAKKKERPVTDHERAYTNFIRHTEFYGMHPVNPNWLMILEHLVNTGHLKYYEGWANEPFYNKLKDAQRAVEEWMSDNFERIMAKKNTVKIAA